MTSRFRAFLYLILLSWQRQARAHLLVWIALGLLACSAMLVLVNTWNSRWNLSYRRAPDAAQKTGTDAVPASAPSTHGDQVRALELASQLPMDFATAATHHAALAGYRAMVFDASGFFVFSNQIVFSLFATFLLPLWTLTFATEGIGREREAGNLLWVLTRPLPRPAVYLAKFLALLPWCLALNVGGFALLCHLAGWPGKLAFQIYWLAVLMGTLAFASLFHFLGSFFRRASVVAILYAFFLESLAGNLPGHLKRLSLSFYTRCLMFDSAHEYGIHPDRPQIFLPVSGAFAFWVLTGVTIVLLGAGMIIFSRKEYMDAT